MKNKLHIYRCFKANYKCLTSFILLFPFFMLSQYETQRFELISSFDNIEIRYYPSSMMIKYDGGKDSSSGFGSLFRYISGSNDLNQKISMTTPVHMRKTENKTTMEFVLPAEIKAKTAPIPSNSSLELYESKAQHYAAIKYGGYTNLEKEIRLSEELISKLKLNNIVVNGESRVLVYNSPYRFINRSNEIIIPIIY